MKNFKIKNNKHLMRLAFSLKLTLDHDLVQRLDNSANFLNFKNVIGKFNFYKDFLKQSAVKFNSDTTDIEKNRKFFIKNFGVTDTPVLVSLNEGTPTTIEISFYITKNDNYQFFIQNVEQNIGAILEQIHPIMLLHASSSEFIPSKEFIENSLSALGDDLPLIINNLTIQTENKFTEEQLSNELFIVSRNNFILENIKNIQNYYYQYFIQALKDNFKIYPAKLFNFYKNNYKYKLKLTFDSSDQKKKIIKSVNQQFRDMLPKDENSSLSIPVPEQFSTQVHVFKEGINSDYLMLSVNSFEYFHDENFVNNHLGGLDFAFTLSLPDKVISCIKNIEIFYNSNELPDDLCKLITDRLTQFLEDLSLENKEKFAKIDVRKELNYLVKNDVFPYFNFSQNDIFKAFDDLGYKKLNGDSFSNGGVCNGLSTLKAMANTLSDKEKSKFHKRLHLMSMIDYGFYSKAQSVLERIMDLADCQKRKYISEFRITYLSSQKIDHSQDFLPYSKTSDLFKSEDFRVGLLAHLEAKFDQAFESLKNILFSKFEKTYFEKAEERLHLNQYISYLRNIATNEILNTNQIQKVKKNQENFQHVTNLFKPFITEIITSGKFAHLSFLFYDVREFMDSVVITQKNNYREILDLEDKNHNQSLNNVVDVISPVALESNPLRSFNVASLLINSHKELEDITINLSSVVDVISSNKRRNCRFILSFFQSLDELDLVGHTIYVEYSFETKNWEIFDPNLPYVKRIEPKDLGVIVNLILKDITEFNKSLDKAPALLDIDFVSNSNDKKTFEEIHSEFINNDNIRKVLLLANNESLFENFDPNMWIKYFKYIINNEDLPAFNHALLGVIFKMQNHNSTRINFPLLLLFIIGFCIHQKKKNFLDSIFLTLNQVGFKLELLISDPDILILTSSGLNESILDKDMLEILVSQNQITSKTVNLWLPILEMFISSLSIYKESNPEFAEKAMNNVSRFKLFLEKVKIALEAHKDIATAESKSSI